MRKTRKWSTKVIAALTVMVIAVSAVGLKTQAEELGTTNENGTRTTVVTEYNSQIAPLTLMGDCEIVLAFTEDGLGMTFSTSSFKTSSVIGVKDIKVQQKMWYGWKTVLTSSGAENYNASMFLADLTYPDAIDGKTYRVTCIHYADYDGYEEVQNDTGAFKFVSSN